VQYVFAWASECQTQGSPRAAHILATPLVPPRTTASQDMINSVGLFLLKTYKLLNVLLSCQTFWNTLKKRHFNFNTFGWRMWCRSCRLWNCKAQLSCTLLHHISTSTYLLHAECLEWIRCNNVQHARIVLWKVRRLIKVLRFVLIWECLWRYYDIDMTFSNKKYQSWSQSSLKWSEDDETSVTYNCDFKIFDKKAAPCKL